MYEEFLSRPVRACPNLSDLGGGKDENWHTMGEKLLSYVSTKFDERQKEFIQTCLHAKAEFQIHGVYEQHVGQCLRTQKLKQIKFPNGQYNLARVHKNYDNKKFNVERPFFVNTLDENEHQIAALITFPSEEYTSQYAELLYAYIKLNLQMVLDGRKEIVFYEGEDTETRIAAAFDLEIDEAEELYAHYFEGDRIRQYFYPQAMLAFSDWSGLDQVLFGHEVIKDGDIVVIGYVDQLRSTLISEYGFSEVGSEVGFRFFGPGNLFGVTVLLSRDEKKRLVLLGFRHSFWGKTAAKIVRSCVEVGAKEIVYVAKAGTRTGPHSLDEKQNKHYLCLIGNNYLIWDGDANNPEGEVRKVNLGDGKVSLANFFAEEKYSKNSSKNHLSVPTVMGEDFLQYQTYGSYNPSTIDNEISYIAEEIADFQSKSNKDNITFTCIHFITDLVASRLNIETVSHEVGLDGDKLDLPAKEEFWGVAANRLAMHVNQNGIEHDGSSLHLPLHNIEQNGIFVRYPNQSGRATTSRVEFEKSEEILSLVDIEGDENARFFDALEGLAPGSNILVCGEAGVGKTVVAECTYNYLSFAYDLNRISSPPYYIDLLSFEKKIIAESSSPVQIVSDILKDLEDELEKSGTRVIIFDGFDPMSSLSSAFKELMESHKHSIVRKSCTCIYFSRIYRSAKQLYRDRSKLLGMDLGPITNFHIGPISDKSGNVSLPSERLAGISQLLTGLDENIVQEAASRIGEWPEFSANLRLINLVLEAEKETSTPLSSPTNFFSEFLSFYLKDNAEGLDIGRLKSLSAQRAYSFVVEGSAFEVTTAEDVLIKRISTQSTEMLCYLSAVWLDTLIFDRPAYDVDRVFPHLINKYTKDLLRLRSGEDAFKPLEALILADRSSLRLKSFVIYLLGRINDRSVTEKCKSLLQSLRRSVVLSEDPDQEELIFDRSINISLIYLGESSRQYICAMLESHARDVINRGFHLAYYGDVDYFSDTDMLSRVDLNTAFPRTMASLRGNLVGLRANRDLENLSAYTLFSLAFARIETASAVPLEIIAELVEFAENDLILRASLFPEVVDFVENCVSFFKASVPPHAFAFEQVSKLKRTPRAGWNDSTSGRRVDEPESVFSHIGSVVYMAVAYLPETEVVRKKAHDGEMDTEYSEYSKDQIIRMLAVHDIGEFGTGDIPSFLKTESDKQAEANYLRRIALLSRLNDTQKQVRYSPLVEAVWVEFAEKNSLNAKIANDLDKIECLCQLQAYRNQPEGSDIRDFNVFRDSLIDKVSTELGKVLLSHFTEHSA
jgi:5'-deoxynucleotidase YfbR-like HD superfamily hydrolase